jgi:exopolysaccharide biosynthesis polyprenyl glycosylphosphotransferase
VSEIAAGGEPFRDGSQGVAVAAMQSRAARLQRALDDVDYASASAWKIRRRYFRMKRVMDVAMAVVLLLCCVPLFLCLAIVIRLDSPGSCFFRQERVGRGGKKFVMLKFRSMYHDAEERIAELRDLNEADGPLFKIRRDPRVTRVGGLLRRFSIDELPQLINVLRGQMSLIGPRPPLNSEVQQYSMRQRRRLNVRPGITGLWQVSGRSDLSFHQGVELDLAYIELCSLWMDLRILVRTVGVVLRSHGAY